jgi:UPF0755 protein
MKKSTLSVLLFLIIVLAATAYIFFAPATVFDEKTKSFIIEIGKTDKDDVIDLLKQKDIIKNGWAFALLANQLNVWNKIRPGKFEVKRSDNLISIVRMLRNNKQVQVKLIINKFRTNEDFARLIGKNLSTDSTSAMQFFSNNDSLKPFSIDSNTIATIIIPNTYSFNWITPISKILSRLKTASDNFWSADNRLDKAKQLGFTPKEIYTLASIVEEETNMESDKGKIASVYINRYHKGMALGADPTIKFALKDFSLKRILFQHLSVQSPYNTYKNKGLPPGPICTPSTNTIDAVLNAPTTDYLYFVAKPDFSGYSNFSSNFAQHSQYAKQYQQALNEYLSKKQSEAP